jgi:gluconokinase
VIVVVMGVSGSGKSTIGALLAARFGCEFLDADEFHPPENVAKMAAGVLACSALKQAYRDRLGAGLDCRFVHLRGSIELIRARLQSRQHRYMPASLLESQFATLEPPAGAIDIDIARPAEDCVTMIVDRLAR